MRGRRDWTNRVANKSFDGVIPIESLRRRTNRAAVWEVQANAAEADGSWYAGDVGITRSLLARNFGRMHTR